MLGEAILTVAMEGPGFHLTIIDDIMIEDIKKKK